MFEEYNEALEIETLRRKIQRLPKERVISLINEIYGEEKNRETEEVGESVGSNDPAPEGEELSPDSE